MDIDDETMVVPHERLLDRVLQSCVMGIVVGLHRRHRSVALRTRNGSPDERCVYVAPIPRPAIGSSASSGNLSGSTTRRLTPKITWSTSARNPATISSVKWSVITRSLRSIAASSGRIVDRTYSGIFLEACGMWSTIGDILRSFDQVSDRVNRCRRTRKTTSLGRCSGFACHLRMLVIGAPPD